MELKRRYSFSFVLILNFLLAVSTVALFFLSKILYEKWIFSIYVTFLTTSYHFIMRLCVGVSVDFAIKKFSVRFKSYIPVSRLEIKFYKRIKVKDWKKNAITAKPDSFDIKKVNFKELLHNMIQAEIVHEIIIPLSFVPLLFIIPFGVPVVFILTSFFAACIELKYVMIQRYNRPRVEKLIGKENV